MSITVSEYLMGRERAHGHLLSVDMRTDAARTVDLVNALLDLATSAGVHLERVPVGTGRSGEGTHITSGWRPPAVNASTPGAASNSQHMQCRAADIYDPDGDLDEWLMSLAGQQALVALGLWHEHPSATKGWAHVQTVPPRSGRRTYYP